MVAIKLSSPITAPVIAATLSGDGGQSLDPLFLTSAWYDRMIEGEVVMGLRQGSTHLLLPDGSVVPVNMGIEVVAADATVEQGEIVSEKCHLDHFCQ